MASPLFHSYLSRNPKGFTSGVRTNQWAYKYVQYIGRREGVVKHETENHGLFGKLAHNNDGEFGIINNIEKAARYVKEKVDDGTYLYDNVVSIAYEDFERLGYDDSADGIKMWQNLVRDNVIKQAEKIHIPASQVEYVAALHIEKGKPNLHYLFWDSEQGVTDGFLTRKIQTSARNNLIKYVYADDIRLFSQTKTRARDSILEGVKVSNEDLFEPLYSMKKSDFKEVTEGVKDDPASMVGKVLNRNIKNSYLDNIRLQIIQLMDKLPQTGRLRHGFLPPDVKTQVEGLAMDIINNISKSNADFRDEIDAYKKSIKDMVKLYYSETYQDGRINLKGIEAIEASEKNAVDDLLKRLSNQLLKYIKNIDYNQYMHGKEEYNKQKNINIQRNATTNLLSSLFRAVRNIGKEDLPTIKPKQKTGASERIEARRDMVKNNETSSNRQQNNNGWER